MGYVLKDKNMIAAIINQETNIVENLAVVADYNWDPGYGLYMVVLEENESCDIGQIYNADDIPRFSGAPTITSPMFNFIVPTCTTHLDTPFSAGEMGEIRGIIRSRVSASKNLVRILPAWIAKAKIST